MSKPKATTKPTATPTAQTQEKKPFVPYTTDQKKEYGQQFSPSERKSYHAGRQSAYQHSANMSGRHARFIRDNNNG